MGDDLKLDREALPDRTRRIAATRAKSEHPEWDEAVQAAVEKVTATWQHLIAEGVMSDTGLASIAETAVVAALSASRSPRDLEAAVDAAERTYTSTAWSKQNRRQKIEEMLDAALPHLGLPDGPDPDCTCFYQQGKRKETMAACPIHDAKFAASKLSRGTG